MAAQGSTRKNMSSPASSSSSTADLGKPGSRVRRKEDFSISLSPAEREGNYTRNPGELALGNLIELKKECELVQKCFYTLPDRLEDLPKMNPCGNYSSFVL